uniref:DUF2511 domain-containing protein n=1 Tax=Caenorhabditis tropicalis TaxID=1561998 RepID=A0A1I7UYY9_9PELO
MKSLVILLFLSIVSYIQSSQEQHALVLAGRSYSVYLEKDSEGIRRQLNKGDTQEQFFYFCDKAKGNNKKNCGAWVDKKGQKIKNANNNVKITEDGGTISKMQLVDSGRYSRFPEHSDEVQAILERVVVSVDEGPKPPKH